MKDLNELKKELKHAVGALISPSADLCQRENTDLVQFRVGEHAIVVIGFGRRAVTTLRTVADLHDDLMSQPQTSIGDLEDELAEGDAA